MSRHLMLLVLFLLIVPVAAQEKDSSQPLPVMSIVRPLWFPQTEEDAAQLARRKLPATLVRAGNYVEFTVNTTADTPDAAPGNGTCADATGKCSLRAAIMQAEARSGPEGIILGAGTYTLTGVDNDSGGGVGDLDIASADGINIYGKTIGAATIISGNAKNRIFEVAATGNLYLSDLTLTGVTTTVPGAAIRNEGTVYGWQLKISNNNTTSYGGGISNTGTLTLSSSSLSNNHADSTGGGLDNYQGTVKLNNVTFSGNSSSTLGGGVFGDDNSLTILRNVTVAYNDAVTGGGVYADTANSGVVEISNTLIALNAATNGPDCNGTITSLGANILRNKTGCTFSATADDQVGTGDVPISVKIETLTNNGGRALTHALQVDSPARDAGNNLTCTTSDARGVSRPQDGDYNGIGLCDIGAYEYARDFTLFNTGTVTTATPIFGWTGTSTAAKYLFELKGVGNTFAYSGTKTKTAVCNGSVCAFSPPLVKFPATGNFQWRVTAITSGGAKTISLWYSFSAKIPAAPVLTRPQDFTTLTNTNVLFRWNHAPSITAYKLNVVNVATGAVIKSYTINANSSVPLSAACTETICSITANQIGAALTTNKSYRWQVTAYTSYRWLVSGAWVSKSYNAKSAWFTFTLTNNPTLQTKDQQWIPLPSGQ